MKSAEVLITNARTSAFVVPTKSPESDGTFAWDATTLLVTEIEAGGVTGLGYTYGHKSIQAVAESLFQRCLLQRPVFDIPQLHAHMRQQVRNDSSRGITAMAISMLDVSLWDLKAKLLGCTVATLLGKASQSVAAYGSGGFTSYSDAQLTEQLSSWAKAGICSVKMKIGSNPLLDPSRVSLVRRAIGPDCRLFVDANGAYTVSQALDLAARFAEQGVSWFEEPVSADWLSELHLIRQRAPAGMDIAAGEYGYDSRYFRLMLDAQAVDVLQADATRCGGYTGFMEAAAIARSYGIQLSAHCAPSLHVHAACAVPNFRHIEYFFDHARIEEKLFDGFRPPKDGMLTPDESRPGIGLSFKRQDAERFAA